jgi:hypothetical protein
MAITLGDTTITGLGVGGLPNGVVNADDLANGAVTASKIGYAGAVLQVVEYTNNAFTASSNTSSAVIDAVSGTITPRFSTSKILILFSVTAGVTSYQNSIAYIVRNGTKIGSNPNTGSGVVGISSQSQGSGYSPADATSTHAGSFLDSPSTTSSISYATVIATRTDSNAGIRLNLPWSRSSNDVGFAMVGVCRMTLMEIAG